MERVVERSNVWLAYQRVVKNQGAPGVDGVMVAEFKDWLKVHWPSVKRALLEGSYLPRPVRRVDIPKPSGGVRTLGVPVVVDRLIQQALHQVVAAAIGQTQIADDQVERLPRRQVERFGDVAGDLHLVIVRPQKTRHHLRSVEVILDQQRDLVGHPLDAEPSVGDRELAHPRSVKATARGSGRRQWIDTIDAL